MTIAVFAEGDAARAAEEAGADHVGAADLAAKVEEGWTDFDVAIATPALMGPVVSKLGRVLGPQGKMPNPKVGTVTDDVAKAVGEAKTGKVEYRTDRQAVIHMTIGKASFTERALLENYAAVIDEIVRAKPAAAKGRYLLSITLTTTMGPGIKVDTGVQREAEILGHDEDETATARHRRRTPAAESRAEEPPAEEPSPAEEPTEEPAARGSRPRSPRPKRTPRRSYTPRPTTSPAEDHWPGPPVTPVQVAPGETVSRARLRAGFFVGTR